MTTQLKRAARRPLAELMTVFFFVVSLEIKRELVVGELKRPRDAAMPLIAALGALSLMGARAPSGLRLFLLAVAIIDDIGAIIVLAVFYSKGIDLAALAAAFAVLLVVITTRAAHRVGWGVFLGLVVGKTVLLTGATLLARRLRVGTLPIATRHVIGGAALTGIGFTVSLFVAGFSFTDNAGPTDAKIAILGASIIAGFVGSIIIMSAQRTRAGRAPCQRM